MAASHCARAFPSFNCRTEPDLSPPEIPSAGSPRFSGKNRSTCFRGTLAAHGLSSLIFKFPPNFVRQLSIKARRNCSNIGVAQVVAASWSNNQASSGCTPAGKAVDAAAAAATTAPVEFETGNKEVVPAAEDALCNNDNVKLNGSPSCEYDSFLSSDGSVAIHAGMLLTCINNI